MGDIAARGKFFLEGEEKLYLRGVTYGTFEPRSDAGGFNEALVASDFTLMRRRGVNAVRTYTVPPRWVLDLADEHRLRVFVGLPWEQHIAFLDDKDRVRGIEQSVREGIRASAGHPAIWAYAIGNEIPAPIVRWHGRRRTERFLERLYLAAKEESPDSLVTYVNYPSTEYLQLPFLDFVSFNVFLEQEERFEAYLARLQNLAGDRPLVLTEIGLDSRRNSLDGQALALGWQIRTAFRSGCAGTFVFSWTDEWHRGGVEVEDWDFGITSRDRSPKPALDAVQHAYREVPFPPTDWPRISVVVCTHNGATTIADCLAGISELHYPNFETIVVDDGSTDETSAIAGEFDIRLIRTENRGLSSARNTGIAAATGEIVAFIDDDARPDSDWLAYLAASFLATPHVGIGGPNIPPPATTRAGSAMAHAPGGPIQVLLSDREAEHIPGCNMAFRKGALEEIGGFDPQFRQAGDDVDICWRLRDRGWTLGFSPAAMVWHRRRPSVRAYLRQQNGYGRAEALLERKWPERYNRGGHLRWSGEVYPGKRMGLRRWRVYYGTWGTGLFQSVYQRAPGTLWSLTMMPEWYLLLGLFGGLSALELSRGAFFSSVPGTGIPLSFALFSLCVALLVAQTAYTSFSLLSGMPRRSAARLRLAARLTGLHLLQPAARLAGRMRSGLTPWRHRGGPGFAFPWTRRYWIWSEDWRPSSAWLAGFEEGIRHSRAAVLRGGVYDRWDFECRVGLLASGRIRMAIEEHGAGRQLLRFVIWPVWSRFLLAAGSVLVIWLVLALFQRPRVALVVGALVLVVAARAIHEAGSAVALLRATITRLPEIIPEADDPPTLDADLAPSRATDGEVVVAPDGRVVPAGAYFARGQSRA